MNELLHDEQIHFFRNELCRFSKMAVAAGLLSDASGLLSVQIADRELMLITPAGKFPGAIEPRDTILFDLKGRRIDSPNGLEAAAEIPFLGNTFRRRKHIRAIGHFYPPYATAFSKTARTIPLVTDVARDGLKEILWVRCTTCPHRFEGLCECFDGQRKNYAGVSNLLIEGDGFVTLGKDLAEVYALADLMERNARSAFWASQPVG